MGLVAQSDDRVVGLIVSGDPGVPGTPQQYFSYADFQARTNPGNIVRTDYPLDLDNQVRDFYLEAGAGAELWVLVVEPAATMANVFLGGAVANLLDTAQGRINVLGIRRWLDGTPAITMLEGLNADVLNAMDEAQAAAVDYASRHQPLRIILDGSHLATDISTLRNLKTLTYNRVGVCIGTNRANDKHAAIGLLLGRIASIPVNRNIGRVKDGAVATSEAYLTSGVSVNAFGLNATAVHNKGYIFLRKHPNRAGYFWNDDHMACPDTDDYFSLANGRVIDKAARIAFSTFLDELLDTVTVDDKGKVLKTTLKQYQSRIERAIGLSMGAAEEISNVEAFIDPNQDILATSKLVVDLRITPTGTNRVILVRLGLYNPNV